MLQKLPLCLDSFASIVSLGLLLLWKLLLRLVGDPSCRMLVLDDIVFLLDTEKKFYITEHKSPTG